MTTSDRDEILKRLKQIAGGEHDLSDLPVIAEAVLLLFQESGANLAVAQAAMKLAKESSKNSGFGA